MISKKCVGHPNWFVTRKFTYCRALENASLNRHRFSFWGGSVVLIFDEAGEERDPVRLG
jgi:hypothetical protein